MANNQKFYWLKLKRDFFKRHDMQIIENMPNGKDYVLFYLKMLLESIDHEGALRFSDTIPYDNNMLSIITNTNIDIVKAAMDLFIGLGMVEIQDDNTIYMNEVERMIGSGASSDNANRQRRFRERQKALALGDGVTKCNASVTQTVTKNNESKSIEKEKEKELEIEQEDKEQQARRIVSLFNETCKSLPSIKRLSASTKSKIIAALDKYTVDDFKAVFEKAEQSDFLTGNTEKGWFASLDWLCDEDNFCKVLNGNYDNKKKKPKGRGGFDMEAYNNMLEKQKNPPKTAAEDDSIRERAEALQQQLAGKGA